MLTCNKLSYHDRAKHTKHPLTRRIFNLIADKQTNLALSADVTTKKELLALAERIGPQICIFKTHIDIIEDFDQDLIVQLQALAQKHEFLLFEDRKFADIGHTVHLQYSAGIYRISDWADIVNAHALPGPGIIDGLKQQGLPKERGLLLIAEMSSKDNLADRKYSEKTLEFAKKNKDFVIGFIAQHQLTDDPDFIYLTPGVGNSNGDNGLDQLGQQYSSVQQVIIDNNSDVIIVGRHIYNDESPETAARNFRELGWQAYLKKIGSLGNTN